MVKAFHLLLQSCPRFNVPFHLGSSLEPACWALGFQFCFVWVCPARGELGQCSTTELHSSPFGVLNLRWGLPKLPRLALNSSQSSCLSFLNFWGNGPTHCQGSALSPFVLFFCFCTKSCYTGDTAGCGLGAPTDWYVAPTSRSLGTVKRLVPGVVTSLSLPSLRSQMLSKGMVLANHRYFL